MLIKARLLPLPRMKRINNASNMEVPNETHSPSHACTRSRRRGCAHLGCNMTERQTMMEQRMDMMQTMMAMMVDRLPQSPAKP